jgi:myosin heavy subunit
LGGNVEFVAAGEGCDLKEAEGGVEAAALLGVGVEDLARSLRFKTIQSGIEAVAVPRTTKEATDSRDALAKELYKFAF